MAFWIPLAAAAISAAGAIQQGRQSAASAKKQMGFQQAMSNTAHQRQVADLRAAGLNPILSARLGGASTPSGAQPNIIPNVGAAGVNSALNAYNTAAQVDEREAHTGLMQEQEATENTKQELYLSQAKRANAEAYLAEKRGHRTFEETEKLIHQMPQFRNEAAFHEWIGPAIKGLAPAKDLTGIAAALSKLFSNPSTAKGIMRGGR